MSFQSSSEYYPNGHPRDPTVIASIYFPYDRTTLDSHDRGILDQVISRYRLVLLGRRASFSFIGFTDHRGTRSFNRRLGRRRAEVVKYYMDSHLGQNQFYSSYAALSRGEEEAHQLRPDREEMASDRRVDVRCSWIHRRVVVRDPILVPGTVPRERRITYRRFSKVATQNIMALPSNPSDIGRAETQEAVGGVIALSQGETAVFENTWGSEARNRRRTTEFPANYRVNRVRMHKEFSVSIDFPARVEEHSAIIRYQWGEPRPWVKVEETIVTLGETTRRRRTLDRNEAESSPILHPPDP